ncbi:MAG: DUF4156 domain-containing protein, partial [Tannerella sp.]|nr:DUF4156 domain-containing protein [Tannerella sp.]
MKHCFFCFLLLMGAVTSLQAQDKIVLRNGRTIEVKVQRSFEDRVEYTYPGETSVYERPKSAISYIQYEDGRKEICDESLRVQDRNTQSRASSSRPSTTTRNRLSSDDDIFWQDVKTTFSEDDVAGMKRLNRISATSGVSFKDAITQLKKKAAAIGGTIILIMNIPESEDGEDIQVMGIAYRDENMEYTPRSASERTAAPTESSSNQRRRRIAQQMERYDNDSRFEANTQPARPSQSTARGTASRSAGSTTRPPEEAPDAVYLLNGRVVRGTIEEYEPDDFVSIRNTAGRVQEFSMDDVKTISRGAAASTSKRATASRGYEDDAKYTRRQSAYEERDRYYDDGGFVSGYRGFFDFGYDIPMPAIAEKGNFEINTSHGYQINEYLFVGAGVGLHIYNAR